jgi:hypothetical protein
VSGVQVPFFVVISVEASYFSIRERNLQLS